MEALRKAASRFRPAASMALLSTSRSPGVGCMSGGSFVLSCLSTNFQQLWQQQQQRKPGDVHHHHQAFHSTLCRPTLSMMNGGVWFQGPRQQELLWARQAQATTQLQQYRFRTAKTNKAVMARFRVTGKGKLKRYRAGHSHNTGKLSKKRKNRLGTSTTFRCKKEEQKMKRLMGL